MHLEPGVFELHARDNGWEQLDADPDRAADLDEYRPTRRWCVPGGELRFIHDTVLRVQYAEIAADPTEPVVRAIEAEFTAYDRDACLEVLDLEQPEQMVTHALRLLAATAPGPFDQRIVEATVAAMHDDRPEVRYWALKVANSTAWSQLLDAVRRLETDDPSDRLRRFAGNSRVILELSAQRGSG